MAAGAVSCSVALGEAEVSKIRDAPVLINTMDHTHGRPGLLIPLQDTFDADFRLGDIIPPDKNNRAKFDYELSFTNKTFHPLSGQEMFIPPPE